MIEHIYSFKTRSSVEFLGTSERNYQEIEEVYILRNFISFNLHQILLGSLHQGE
jgi:hypothetical protein